MNNKKIINFFFEIASLRRLTRSGRQMIQGANDNISDHSFRVAIIGMILANLEGCDENKVMKMCLFHDLVEARTGDANFINKQYVKQDEEGARKDQMNDLPLGGQILEILKEFENKDSKEAIVSKDADLVDQMVLQQEYFHNDKTNRPIWQKHTMKELKTESAKELAAELKDTNPLEWLYVISDDKTKENVQR